MAKKKILLVDDDPLIVRLYQNKLSGDGYEVATAHNGEEGLKQAKFSKPNLIFLDVMMPKMTGIEVIKELKKDKDLKKVPVVFLTNLSESGGRVSDAKKLGAEDYLVKADTTLKELSAIAKKLIGG